MAARQGDPIMKLLAANLMPGQTRAAICGELLATVHYDNNIVLNFSTTHALDHRQQQRDDQTLIQAHEHHVEAQYLLRMLAQKAAKLSVGQLYVLNRLLGADFTDRTVDRFVPSMPFTDSQISEAKTLCAPPQPTLLPEIEEYGELQQRLVKRKNGEMSEEDINRLFTPYTRLPYQTISAQKLARIKILRCFPTYALKDLSSLRGGHAPSVKENLIHEIIRVEGIDKSSVRLRGFFRNQVLALQKIHPICKYRLSTIFSA